MFAGLIENPASFQADGQFCPSAFSFIQITLKPTGGILLSIVKAFRIDVNQETGETDRERSIYIELFPYRVF
jgi:hypothetical protein